MTALPSDADVTALATRINQREQINKAITDRQRELLHLTTQLGEVNVDIDARRAAIAAGQKFVPPQTTPSNP